MLQQSDRTINASRRGFLKGSAALAGALCIPLPVLASGRTVDSGPHGTNEITDWIWIEPNGKITLGLSQCECGQGVYTGMPQILADELDADWENITVIFVTGRDAYRTGAAYEEPQQFVGASMSATLFYQRLRIAGAQAREVLTIAAAKQLHVRPGQCYTEKGRVFHGATGRSIGYGELAEAAAKLPLNPTPRLKAEADHKLIGKNLLRLDTPAKVDGSAEFGIDVRVPGMLYGALKMPPTVTGKVTGIRNADVVKAMPGVQAVVQAPDAAIVVATSYWLAKKGADALELEVDPGASRDLDSDKIMAARVAALGAPEAVVATTLGEPDAVLAAGGKRVEADYHTPYIVHATMESVNATVHVRDDAIEVWGPIQGQDFVRNALGKLYQRKPETIIVHTTFLGGSFGRKFLPDFVVHAARASAAVGKPVKVIRSREDDIRHGFYRPGVSGGFRAVLDEKGMPKAMHARLTGQSLYGVIKAERMAQHGGWDETMLEAIYDCVYRVPNLKVDMIDVKQPIPVSFMRSVGSTSSIFMLESFVNEMADAAGMDPYRYRRALLVHNPLAVRTLDAAAKAANWDRKPAPGVTRGFTFNLYTGRGEAFQTYVAMALELERAGKAFKVRRVVCAVECGRSINPNLIRANIEGGIGFALTNTLKSEITFKGGVVQQSNFHDYPLLQLSEMPKIETVIVESDRPPQGCGEVSLGPTAPAVAHALYQATKKRRRSMPMGLEG
ncbi:molybdopterin cofactor-binding domain-containing protein [Cupriavidus sp. SW-Y-13]|uniref:xanthine dehydrogenase family protein molybdopterin-binding subunit n=1 Tax=Cupriavidus sp. SW-Y-13 TaxID=2653854 RepID=UPI0013662228|nr:molybdopterin cofactor-binding domain-containing protein [Cupriavidus sp. SW-Y-13]MWL91120.1 molybdopterin-dependent oxidoreductase [Cupriavidus sp. SW-Y-13]